MAQPPVLRGTLRDDGAIALLRDLELKRITGTLQFEGEDAKGEIAIYGGAIALDQPSREDGQDPVDLFLGLGAGRYEVHQRLPPLAVSRGDDFSKHGSLAVHVPADLMSYCEHAGLSGVLELRNEGRRLEAIYDAGELIAIELDGQGDADLSEVFAWEQGRFRIVIDLAAVGRLDGADDVDGVDAADGADAPTTKRAKPRKREDTGQFLRVVQMALVDVLDQSERARSPTRTSPPLPELPKARPRASDPPPRRRAETQTVRLVYLSGDAPTLDEDTSTRHVQRGPQAELALTEAEPQRRPLSGNPESSPPASEPMESSEMATKNDSETDPEAPVDEPEADALPTAGAGAWTEPADDDSEPHAEAAEAPTPSEPAGKPAPARPGNPLGAAMWALVLLTLGLGILAILARLPEVG